MSSSILDIKIRKFVPADRPAIRRISFKTSFLGSPEFFINHEEAVADALTLYFTDYEPESSFVAIQGEKVIGYLTGTKNAARMNAMVNSRIFPQLWRHAFGQGLIFQKKILTLLWYMGGSALKWEFSLPDVTDRYPALLHINIDESFRGRGVGRALMDYFLDYLKSERIPGVHCATLSDDAYRFFTSAGFYLLLKKPRTYLRYHFKKEMFYYLLGKTLR